MLCTMTGRPAQVDPNADYVRSRVDLSVGDRSISIASGTPLPCGSIIVSLFQGSKHVKKQQYY